MVGRGREGHAIPVVTRARGDRDVRVVVVAVVTRLAGELGRRPVAVADRRGSHQGGAGDRRSQVGEAIRARLDQQNAALRADRRDHLDVQVDLLSPADVSRRERGGVAVLVHLPEAAGLGRAQRQFELGAVGREVGVGIRVVVRVDDGDRDTVARPRRPGRIARLVGARKVGRVVAELTVASGETPSSSVTTLA